MEFFIEGWGGCGGNGACKGDMTLSYSHKLEQLYNKVIMSVWNSLPGYEKNELTGDGAPVPPLPCGPGLVDNSGNNGCGEVTPECDPVYLEEDKPCVDAPPCFQRGTFSGSNNVGSMMGEVINGKFYPVAPSSGRVSSSFDCGRCGGGKTRVPSTDVDNDGKSQGEEDEDEKDKDAPAQA